MTPYQMFLNGYFLLFYEILIEKKEGFTPPFLLNSKTLKIILKDVYQTF